VCYNQTGNNGGGVFYAVQEYQPIKIFRADRPANNANGSYNNGTLNYQQWTQAETVAKSLVSDLSRCVVNPSNGNLVLLSHEGSGLIEIDSNGSLVSTLILNGAQQFEGVTYGVGNEIVVVSEPNLVRRYEASQSSNDNGGEDEETPGGEIPQGV